MIIFLFPLTNMIVAAQLVFVCIWWGAAASKLNHHFPFVVTVMISNTPWNRSKSMKRRLYRQPPRRPDPLRCRRPGRPPRDGDRVHPAADPAALPGRADRLAGGRRDGDLPPPHPLHVPARRSARVERLHDLRRPLPLRPLRRRPLVDDRRPAAAADPRRDLRRDPDPRQLQAGPDLLPALDALLRRQLGDQRVVVQQGERGGEEARSQGEEGRADRRRAAPRALRRRPGRGADLQGARVPLDALARPRAERFAAPGGRRRRRLRRPRRRGRRRCGPRLQLRRRPLPQRGTARRGPGALRLRAG